MDSPKRMSVVFIKPLTVNYSSRKNFGTALFGTGIALRCIPLEYLIDSFVFPTIPPSLSCKLVLVLRMCLMRCVFYFVMLPLSLRWVRHLQICRCSCRMQECRRTVMCWTAPSYMHAACACHCLHGNYPMVRSPMRR